MELILLSMNGQNCLIIVQKAINPGVPNIVEFRKQAWGSVESFCVRELIMSIPAFTRARQKMISSVDST